MKTDRIGARLSLEPLEERFLPAGRVRNPIPNPSPAVVRIELRWDTPNDRGQTDGVYNPGPAYRDASGVLHAHDVAFQGSGAMVSPYHVLTAAHVVHPAANSFTGAPSDTPTWIVVFAGQQGPNSRPFGEALAVRRDFHPRFLTTNYGYDLGLLTLDRNLGDFTGYFTYGWAADQILPQQIQVMGYPSSANQAQTSRRGPLQYPSLIGDLREKLYFPSDLTDHGGSGSPVIDTSAEWIYPTILGVYDNKAIYNEASRITPEKYRWLTSITQQNQQQNRPVDRPDLFDRDAWFNERGSYFRANPVRTARGIVINVLIGARIWNGGMRTAGGFTVRFFAESVSTGRRYLIDDRTVTQLQPLQTTTSWEAGYLPLSLPAGRYKIGWIIDARDSVREAKEVRDLGFGPNIRFNNVGYVLGRVIDVPTGQIVAANNAPLAAAALVLPETGRPAAPAPVNSGQAPAGAPALAAVSDEGEKPPANGLSLSTSGAGRPKVGNGRASLVDAVFSSASLLPLGDVTLPA